MKNLIKCPRCEQEGVTQNIGAIAHDGNISILRRFQPRTFLGSNNYITSDKSPVREYTIVRGVDFELVCGRCGEIVFIKKGGSISEVSSHWIARVSRVTYSGTFGEQGTNSFAG